MLPLTQFEMSALTCSNFRFCFRCGFLLFIFLSSLSWSRVMTYPKALKMCTSWPLILLSLGHKMGNEVVTSKCNICTPQLLALMCKKQWPEVGPPLESSHNLSGSLLHGLDAKWQGVVLRIVHQCKWQVPVTMKMCGMIMSWFSEKAFIFLFLPSCTHLLTIDIVANGHSNKIEAGLYAQLNVYNNDLEWSHQTLPHFYSGDI